MGLFSFLKKKKPEEKIPTPPSPPGARPIPSEVGAPKPIVPRPEMPPAQGSEDIPAPRPIGEMKKGPQPIKPRQVDDFGIPSKGEELELPDIQFPTMPSSEKQEVEKAIKEKAEVPEEPADEIPAPEAPEIEIEEPESEISIEEPEEIPSEAPEELPGLGEPKPEEKGLETVALPELPKAEGSIFIRSDKFNLVKRGIVSLKDNLKVMDKVFTMMTEIKNKQDADVDAWHSSVEAIQRKLIYMDKTIFENR
ncbi:hypothetical protein ACFL96_07105 [Thermoproteota archaeon]